MNEADPLPAATWESLYACADALIDKTGGTAGGLFLGTDPPLLLIPDAALFQLSATGHAPPDEDGVFKLTSRNGRIVYAYVALPELVASILGMWT